MIDKIWNDWQHADPANLWSFGGGSVMVIGSNGFPEPDYPNGNLPFVNVSGPLYKRLFTVSEPLSQFATPMPADGIMNDYTVYDLMDTLSERLCYVYE